MTALSLRGLPGRDLLSHARTGWRAVLLTLVTAVLGCALPGLMTSANAHGVTLVVQHHLPADSPFHTQFLQPWIQKLEKDSAGLLRFRLFPAMGQGGQPAELAEQVSTRTIDIALTLTRHDPGRFPAIEAFEALPIKHNAAGASKAAWEYVRLNDLLDKEFTDARLLAVAVTPGERGSEVALLLMNARSFKALTEDLRKVVNANSGADTSVTLARSLAGNGGAQPVAAQLDEWIKRATERGVNARALADSARELMAEYDTGK